VPEVEKRRQRWLIHLSWQSIGLLVSRQAFEWMDHPLWSGLLSRLEQSHALQPCLACRDQRSGVTLFFQHKSVASINAFEESGKHSPSSGSSILPSPPRIN
jgi:hypothetical protein